MIEYEFGQWVIRGIDTDRLSHIFRILKGSMDSSLKSVLPITDGSNLAGVRLNQAHPSDVTKHLLKFGIFCPKRK
ncbi:hypothetical protein LCA82_26250 [Vibrio harveyi]